MIKKILLILFTCNSIFGFDYEANSGEILLIQIDNKEFKTNKMIISKNNKHYLVIGIPYSIKRKITNLGGYKIQINPIDYGESRITINDDSKVNPSKENIERAIRESKLLKDSIKLSDIKKIPDLDFLKPVNGIISSRYGKARFINGMRRSPHLGLDIAAPIGTPVISPSNGKVILIGDFFYSGRFILIDHGSGLLTSYSHLDSLEVINNQILLSSILI
mgnify:CR=1 FL=1